MYKFINKKLKPEENVIAVKRRHSIVYFIPIFICTLIIFADFFLLFWFLQYKIWGLLGFLVILILALIYLIRKILIWYFHLTIITNFRIIDCDQKGIFSRSQKECFVDKIVEVSYNKKGIFATIFNYGNIQIKTASESAGLEIDSVSKPDSVKEMITEIQQQKNYSTEKSQIIIEKKIDNKDSKNDNKIEWGSF